MRPFHRDTMLRPLLLARAFAPIALVTVLLSGCGGAASQGMPPPPPPPPPPHATTLSQDEIAPPAQLPSFMRVGTVEPAEMAAVATAAPTASPVANIAPAPTNKNRPREPSKATTSSPDSTARADAEAEGDSDDAGAAPPTGGGGGSSGKKVEGAVVDAKTGISEADVRAAVAAKGASFRSCYEIGMKSAPDFAGAVTLRVSISPAGNVASAEVLSSSTKNQNVDACVREEVRKLVFKTTGSGAVVAFPIEFGR